MDGLGCSIGGLAKDGLGSFSSDSRRLPSKPIRGVLGKVKKAFEGVQYLLFNGEKGSNDERRGFLTTPFFR